MIEKGITATPLLTVMKRFTEDAAYTAQTTAGVQLKQKPQCRIWHSHTLTKALVFQSPAGGQGPHQAVR